MAVGFAPRGGLAFERVFIMRWFMITVMSRSRHDTINTAEP